MHDKDCSNRSSRAYSKTEFCVGLYSLHHISGVGKEGGVRVLGTTPTSSHRQSGIWFSRGTSLHTAGKELDHCSGCTTRNVDVIKQPRLFISTTFHLVLIIDLELEVLICPRMHHLMSNTFLEVDFFFQSKIPRSPT